MIITIKKSLYIASFVLLGCLVLFSCESESDNIGQQLFTDIAADGVQESYDVTAYNINNNDSIRSDASQIGYAQLGVFDELIFGSQKATYVSQLRLSTYDPDFGDNAVVDSVVLVMNTINQTIYESSAQTIYDASLSNTSTSPVIYPDGNVDATINTTSYPIYKYGKTELNGSPTLLNIQVHEVTEFLKGSSTLRFSNDNITYGNLLGTKIFDGNVRQTNIISDADNSTLWTSGTNPSIRIPLDAAFFQNKIIAKEGTQDLEDVASFARYFQGIRLSVNNTDGYLFPFNTNNVEIIMYYTNDQDDNGTITRVQNTFKFTLGPSSSSTSNYNTHIGLYDFNRTGTVVADALSNINTINGDNKLYLQGMGGPSFAIKIPDATIADLKNKINNEKVGVVSARIRVYTDETIWNNNYTKPNSLVFLEKDAKELLLENSTLLNAPNYQLIRAYDLDKNPAYYDLTVTSSLKDILENETANKTFLVQIGDFRLNASLQPAGYNFTSRSYSPHRMVMVGSDLNNDKRIKLNIVYGKKNKLK